MAVIVLAAGAGAAGALASVFTYAQGINGVNGIFNTPGYSGRDYNRVYHHQGDQWTLYYCYPGPPVTCSTYVTGTVNPLVDPRGGYAQAYCWNRNDSSGVVWTCQTTQP